MRANLVLAMISEIDVAVLKNHISGPWRPKIF